MLTAEHKEHVNHQTTPNTHTGEVNIYISNNGNVKVEAISGNISAYGYAPEEFTSGKINILDIIYGEDIPEVMMHTGEHLKNKSECFTLNSRILDKNGTPVRITTTLIPTYNPDGGITGYFVKFININLDRQLHQNEYKPMKNNGTVDVPEQKYTKQQRITERNRLRTLGNHFPYGCLFCLEIDSHTKQVAFTYLSKTWEQQTGLKPADVLQNADLAFKRIHPDDLRLVMQQIDAPDQHQNFNSRIRFHHPDGSTLWLRVSTHRHFEDSRRVYDGFILDITPHKIAEQELEDSRSRQNLLYRTLQIFQSSEDTSRAIGLAMDETGKYFGIDRIYIAERDSDNTYEWYNTGIAPLKERFRDLRTVYDRLNNGKYIQISGPAGLSPDILQFHKDAGIMSALCFPLVTDGINYGYACYDDCTTNREWNNNEIELLGGLSQIFANSIRRHRAETSIRLSQQTLRTVMDNINSNIVVTDFDSRQILFANRKLKEDMGDDDMEGKVCWKVLRTGEKCPCNNCPHPHLRDAQNNPTGFYKWEYHNNLSGKWYECIDTAIEWVDGRMVHLQHSLDITDRKTDELELISARKKAEESDRLKSAFLANISHEIRTPLNGISGFLQFLASGDLALELRQKYVQVVNTCSRQLMRLIDDVIDIAKVEANSLNVFPAVTDINQIMRELLPVFETELEIRNKDTVTLMLDDTGFIYPGVTYVDPVRLRQTLSHLIDNAIKFTHKGYIRFGYRLQSPDMLEFEVEDTGIGIPEEMHGIIFERFRQVEQGNSQFHRGTGIGLTISQNLVELMGGRMWLQSSVGQGSTFSFTIPYLPVAPPSDQR